MQLPSVGQQSTLLIVKSVVFPEHAHFITLMPPAPKVNSIKVVNVIAMFATNLIAIAKIQKSFYFVYLQMEKNCLILITLSL